MRRRLPPLSALQTFEAAARLQSFTEASKELLVTQSAVSRGISTLETYLGLQLFHRANRTVQLTSQGQEYYHAVFHSFEALEHATTRVLSKRGTDAITVNVLPTLAIQWLIPKLSEFSEENQDLEVRLVTSIKSVDFALEDSDFAIRVGQPPDRGPPDQGPRIDLEICRQWSGVRTDFLFPDILVAVCSKTLLDSGPPLKEPADLRHHVLLHNVTRPHAWPDWLKACGLGGLAPKADLSYGHFFMALQAAREGRGIALIPHVLLQDYLALGELVIPFSDAVPSAGAYYLLSREKDQDAPGIQRFRRWVLDEAGAYEPWPRAVALDGASPR